MTTRELTVEFDASTSSAASASAPPAQGTPSAPKVHSHAPHRDDEGAKIGMWLFLFTEILLFGGLFILFSVYFQQYPEGFHTAGKLLNRVLGTTNTAVLLTSSLLVVLAVGAIQRGQSALSRRYLLATIGCAFIFLIIKYVEWSTKIEHGIYPNGPEYMTFPVGEKAFFNLYYLMTGLHAIHVIIGGSVIYWVWLRIGKGLITKDRCIMVENVGLYWHVVDLIWIYLFPLFYLAM